MFLSLSQFKCKSNNNNALNKKNSLLLHFTIVTVNIQHLRRIGHRIILFFVFFFLSILNWASTRLCLCVRLHMWANEHMKNEICIQHFFCIIYSICVFIFFCIVTFAQQWTCNVKVIVVFSIFLLLLLLLSLLLLLLSLVYFTFGFLYVSQHTQLHANIRYWIVAYQSYCFILLS